MIRLLMRGIFQLIFKFTLVLHIYLIIVELNLRFSSKFNQKLMKLKTHEPHDTRDPKGL